MLISACLADKLAPEVNFGVLSFPIHSRCYGPEVLDAEVPIPDEDWAKLLLWSFVAGFAKRFVPDTLDSVRCPE